MSNEQGYVYRVAIKNDDWSDALHSCIFGLAGARSYMNEVLNSTAWPYDKIWIERKSNGPWERMLTP